MDKLVTEQRVLVELNRIISGEYDPCIDTINEKLDDCVHSLEKMGLLDKYDKPNSLVHKACDYLDKFILGINLVHESQQGVATPPHLIRKENCKAQLLNKVFYQLNDGEYSLIRFLEDGNVVVTDGECDPSVDLYDLWQKLRPSFTDNPQECFGTYATFEDRIVLSLSNSVLCEAVMLDAALILNRHNIESEKYCFDEKYRYFLI